LLSTSEEIENKMAKTDLNITKHETKLNELGSHIYREEPVQKALNFTETEPQ
jgi:hypothetical protein